MYDSCIIITCCSSNKIFIFEIIIIILDAAIQQFSGYTNYHARIDHCSAGSALYHLWSQHHNSYQDRRWTFVCRMISLTQLTSCQWTPQIH